VLVFNYPWKALLSASLTIALAAEGYSSLMPAPPATIEQLARDTVRIADPETALRALTALRQELDATESEIVRRALHAGASWSQVARALGVSKQAAHRKYRHLFDQTWGPDEPRVMVSPEVRQSIQFAREEAKRLAQPAVGTEHVLLGVLRCEGSHAVSALNAEGVTLEAARGCLQTTMPGVTPSAVSPPDDDPAAVSAHARRILQGSKREALRRGDAAIGVEHLLLALLSDSRNGAVQTIEALRTTPTRIRRRLDQAWTAPAVTAGEPQVTSRSRPVSTS
jgi:ATP-dependent Clp protease ATP-binding subunit ClpA